jgi:hypothetical protein
MELYHLAKVTDLKRQTLGVDLGTAAIDYAIADEFAEVTAPPHTASNVCFGRPQPRSSSAIAAGTAPFGRFSASTNARIASTVCLPCLVHQARRSKLSG